MQEEEEKEEETISNKSNYLKTFWTSFRISLVLFCIRSVFSILVSVFLLYFSVCNPVYKEEGSISNKSNYFPTSSTFFRPSLSHQRVINLHNAVMALGADI